MKKRKLACLVLAVVLIVSAMLTGCGNAGSADSSTLAVVTGPEPDTIDPALNSAVDGGTIIVHAF